MCYVADRTDTNWFHKPKLWEGQGSTGTLVTHNLRDTKGNNVTQRSTKVEKISLPLHNSYSDVFF